jgi:hypothetical protein
VKRCVISVKEFIIIYRLLNLRKTTTQALGWSCCPRRHHKIASNAHAAVDDKGTIRGYHLMPSTKPILAPVFVEFHSGAMSRCRQNLESAQGADSEPCAFRLRDVDVN